MRLPQYVLEAADPRHARIVVSGNPGQSFDIGPAGPEWRFVSAHAGEAEWCAQPTNLPAPEQASRIFRAENRCAVTGKERATRQLACGDPTITRDAVAPTARHASSIAFPSAA
jgi:hypothetical protein